MVPAGASRYMQGAMAMEAAMEVKEPAGSSWQVLVNGWRWVAAPMAEVAGVEVAGSSE